MLNLKKPGKKSLKYIIYNLDILLFIVAVTAKMLKYDSFINPTGQTLKYIFPPVLASTSIIAGTALFFRKEIRVKFLLFTDFILSFIIFSDSLYFIFFKDIISTAAIRNSFLLKDVGTSAVSVMRPEFLLYFADLLLFIPIFVLFERNKKGGSSISKRVCAGTLIIITAAVVNIRCYGNLAKEQPRLMQTMSNKVYIAKALGSINYHVIDAYNSISAHLEKSKLTESRQKELEAFLTTKAATEGGNLKGAGVGKNLIVIQVEALQQFVINNKVNGEEITPNLNKFINRSLYFDNFYYQVAEGNTSDAEFMVNNSLYPASSGAAYYRYGNVTYKGLPAKLKEKGYYTAALHGNSEGFWNRNVMYKSMQFDDFYGETRFNMDEKISLGLSDKSFFKQSLEFIDSFKKPFYSFLVTLSSHHPYKDEMNFGDFKVGTLEGSMLGDYIKSIHYADNQLGIFLKGLEEKGYLQNSIVVIYGDHNALPKQNDEEIFRFLGTDSKDDFVWMQHQKVPFLIHFPNDNYKGINHTLAGQMDVLPTLSNILELNGTKYFGADILNKEERFLIFRNGSFTDGKFMFIAPTNTYYDMSSGKIVEDKEKLTKFRDEAELQLSYSDDILDHNLFKRFIEEAVEN